MVPDTGPFVIASPFSGHNSGYPPFALLHHLLPLVEPLGTFTDLAGPLRPFGCASRRPTVNRDWQVDCRQFGIADALAAVVALKLCFDPLGPGRISVSGERVTPVIARACSALGLPACSWLWATSCIAVSRTAPK